MIQVEVATSWSCTRNQGQEIMGWMMIDSAQQQSISDHGQEDRSDLFVVFVKSEGKTEDEHTTGVHRP